MINELIEQIGGRERLEAIVYAMGAEPCDADPILDSVTHGDIGKMARALLAVLDAKPDFYIHRVEVCDTYGPEVELRAFNCQLDASKCRDDHGGEVIEAFTTPPAAGAPDGLADAVNRLLDSDGSRGTFSAIRRGDALAEVERLLAAAPAPGCDGG